MEKTFEAIMQTVDAGYEITFKKKRHGSSIINVSIFNPNSRSGFNFSFTQELAMQTAPIVKDEAISTMIIQGLNKVY